MCYVLLLLFFLLEHMVTVFAPWVGSFSSIKLWNRYVNKKVSLEPGSTKL